MDKQDMPEYETIRAAVAGEAWAVEKIVAHYADYIAEMATVEVSQPDGSKKRVVDEDIRQAVTLKLIEAIPQFPLDELEQQEKQA